MFYNCHVGITEDNAEKVQSLKYLMLCSITAALEPLPLRAPTFSTVIANFSYFKYMAACNISEGRFQFHVCAIRLCV